MRSLFLASLLLLSACRQEDEAAANMTVEDSAVPSGTLPVTFAGAGRDRLCLKEGEGRAGFITYGEGDANCSVSGAVQRAGERLTITPDGDAACRIEATLAGEQLTLGQASPACAYYCGPTASFSARQFARTATPQPVTDLAGDPLC